MNYQQAQRAILSNQKVYCILPIFKGVTTIYPTAIRRSKNCVVINYRCKLVNSNMLRRVALNQEFMVA